MKNMLKLVLAAMLSVLDDLCYLSGAVLIAFGAGMVYPPAAYIAGGVALVAYALLISRK